MSSTPYLNSATELKEWFEGKDFQAIYFKNSIKEAYYLTGYGTREQFARLYKTIYQFPEFDVRYKLDELSHYLKIDKILLIKMIQIFDELDFVTIDNGVMTVNKEAEKREIEDSQDFPRSETTRQVPRTHGSGNTTGNL